MKNSFEQTILEQLEKIKKQLSDQQKHIDVLDQKLSNPTYEFHSSLVGNQSSKKYSNNTQHFSWMHYIPIIILTLFSIGIGSWLLRISWYAPLYQIILLIYATGVIVAGMLTSKKSIRILGYVSYVATICFIVISYKCNHLLHPQTSIILHSLLIGILVSLIILFLTVKYYKKNLSTKEYKILFQCLTIAIPLTLFIWGATAIILIFDRFSGQPSFFMKPFMEYSRAYDTIIRMDITQFLLTMYYMLFGFISIVLGVRYKNAILRVIGYIVTILAGYSGLIVARNGHNQLYITILILLGIFLAGIGFYFYKKR